MQQPKQLHPETATKGQLEQYFIAQRSEIFFRIVRMISQMATINQQPRFQLTPIEIDLNFSQQIGVYLGVPEEERRKVLTNALAFLQQIENPSPIITPEQFRRNGN